MSSVAVPIVAIVGRPNVGKSTLFNRITGERNAIVEDRARTTRDRLYGEGEWNGRRFIVVDTGGLEVSTIDQIELKVQEQARLAIAEADLIVFVTDAESGLTPADLEAAELLRHAHAPVLLVVNKVDNQKRELDANEFYELGWEEILPVSAAHGRGTGDMLDALVMALPPESPEELERKKRQEEIEFWANEIAKGAELGPLNRKPAARPGAPKGLSMLAPEDEETVEAPAAQAPSAAGAEAIDAEDEAEGEELAPEDEETTLESGDFAFEYDEDELDLDEDGLGDFEAGFDEDEAGHAGWATAGSLLEAEWDAETEAADLGPVKIAIVGRPNVGKSSLTNSLLGYERTIVSNIPGTTRDAIDTTLEWGGGEVVLIDTAGIRRPGKVASGPAAERFATLRSLRAVERADVAIVVIDAVDGLTAQDAHIAGYVVEQGKGLVVAVNKWDLIEKTDRTFDEYVSRIRRDAPFLDFAPVVSISALTKQRIERVLELSVDVWGERRRRISTGALNRLLADAVERSEPPTVRGKRIRLYYATQAGVAPPTFVIFTNDAPAIHFSYRRYLENRIRETYGFDGTPIRLVFRNRGIPKAKTVRTGAGAGSGMGPSAGAGRPGIRRAGGGQSSGKGSAAGRSAGGRTSGRGPSKRKG